MPFFKPRAPPQNDVEVILESIANGQFDDDTINELQRLADLSDDEEIDRIAEALLSYIMRTEDRNVLIGTVKALTVLPFLPEGKDEDVIRLMVTLFAVPPNMRITLQHKMLQNEILKFLLSMIKMDESYAKLMMSELIASLEYAYITNDAEAYPALEMLARNKPEYFRPHTETLVKLLGSINKATRAQSAKLIGIIGGKYPEYVSSAMPVLQSLASFYPDAQVKHNASEAYQILFHGLRLDVVDTVSMKDNDKPKQRSMGFADILKKKAAELLSKPPHETPGERQRAARNAARERVSRDRSLSYHATGGGSVSAGHMTQSQSQHASESTSEDVNLSDMEGFETEIKGILDRTRDEFTNDAEGILNSIGVGHLSIRNRDKLTITSDEKLSNDMTASDGGVASQQPEAERQPIHARTSHLDIGTKRKPATVQDMDSKPTGSKTDTEPEKHADHGKKLQEESELHPEKRSKPAPVHSAHSLPVKAGFEKDLQGRLAARSIEKSPRLIRSPHEKIIDKKPVGHDAITLTGEKDKPAAQALPANEEKLAAKEIKDQSGMGIVQDTKPLSQEGAPAKNIENKIMLGSIKTEESPIQEKKIAELETQDIQSSIKAEEPSTIEKQKVREIIKTEDKVIHKEAKHIKPAEPEIQKEDRDGKLELSPAKRMEKAIEWKNKHAMPAPVKSTGTPIENLKTPMIREEPSAKRVEKVLAWFEKVGTPEPEQPKIEHQPVDIELHSGRVPVKASPETTIHNPKPVPKTETVPQQAKVEAHHAQHTIKPPASPENKKDEARVKTAVEKTIPPTVEKPIPPKMEHKMESSVLPPKAAVSRHETSWPSDPITPPVARKIGVSKIGMTEKPLEGKDEGKKGTIVPGTSVSGFGQNKRIYQCPKCGGRTLVEGELCKICKMTMEHPQEMVRCERCGLMNNRNIKFCRKCGAKLDKDKI